MPMNNIIMFHKPHGKKKNDVPDYIRKMLARALDKMGITTELLNSLVPEKKAKKSAVNSNVG